jgi:replicative DNA helicase
MPLDNELRLVSRLLRDRDITPALERGITLDWFQNDDARRYWSHVLKHWQAYSEVPTVNAVKLSYPGAAFPKIEDTAEYLIDEFVAYRRRKETIRLVQDAQEIIEDANDHEAALARLATGLAQIGDTGDSQSRDIQLTDKLYDRVQRYLDLDGVFAGGLRGLPTGFPTIDKATLGLQKQQLVTLIAPPKTGKSTLALVIADFIHQHAGKHPMFIGFEMSNDEQEARWLARRARISHSRMLSGRLKKEEKLRLRALKDQVHEIPFTLSDAASASTVSGIAAKVEKHKPDIVFVDGAYLMLDEITGEMNTPQAITNNTRALKRLAQRFDIPVVISTQVLLWKMNKRTGVTADAIGYSSSFYQDSDVIIGLQRTDADDDDQRILRIVASRNCGPEEVTVLWEWETGEFSEPDPQQFALGGGDADDDDVG